MLAQSWPRRGGDRRREGCLAEEFILIAHRGFSSKAPENTLAAFDLALAEGFSHFELDAQLSADGVPVVIHDAHLDRTTSGAGPVACATVDEIAALDAGGWFGSGREFAGQRVPTLAEVLSRYAARAHIHLELKSAEPELPGRVAALVREHGWDRWARARDPFAAPGLTITSFSYDQLRRSVAAHPGYVRHGWLVERIEQAILDAALALPVAGIYVRASHATAESIQAALEKGLQVRGWGVETVDQLRGLISAGAQGTTVDWPDVARSAIAVHPGHHPAT